MKTQQEEEFLLDTPEMSEEKRQALEMTEGAREKEYKHPSFGSQLFLGNFAEEMLFPFPEQSDEDKRIGDEMIAKVTEALHEHLDPDEVDETRTIPESLIQVFRDIGVFALKIPKKYGGMGFSQVNYNRVIQTIASYCGSTAVLISAHQSIGVPEPLKMFGTEEQKQQFLPRFRQGAISAFALTEPDVGSDPANLSTTASPSEDGSYYLLNGEKLWCTNGPIADLIVVMALTPPKFVKGREKKQITAFVVDTTTPGVETIHRCDFMGIRGIQNGLLRFTDVKVPAENIIWEKGRGLALALATLNTGRLTVPAACIGMAKTCVHIARKWGNERSQWGSPVGYHEEGRQKVAFLASSTLAIEAVTWLTSFMADRGDSDIRFEAAMAKYFSSELSWKMADMTLQFRGGRGYEKATSLKDRGEIGYPVERMMRDSRINTIIEGTSEIMRLFLAREALDPHLSKVLSLLKKGFSFKKVFNLIGFYATWYPKLWIPRTLWRRHNDAGKLAKHLRFVDSHSQRLARTLFHKMARYQQGLETKQMLLSRLVDIGTELFAMAATCSYAQMLKEKGNEEALDLAEHFCTLATRRVNDLFSDLSNNDDEVGNQLAEKVLEGKTRWLEEGIIGVDLDD